MAKFRDIRTLQKIAAVHASIYNHFHQERLLNRRNVFNEKRALALAQWRQLAA
jgi:putative transposase